MITRYNNCIDIYYCKRQALNIPSGERYELCESVHAEANALLHAGREKSLGGKLYLAGFNRENDNEPLDAEPCGMCKKFIINCGIEEVITRDIDGNAKNTKVKTWIDSGWEKVHLRKSVSG